MSQKSGGEVGPPPSAPQASGESSNHLIKTMIWDHPLSKLFPENRGGEPDNLQSVVEGNFTLSQVPHSEYVWLVLCLYLNNGILILQAWHIHIRFHSGIQRFLLVKPVGGRIPSDKLICSWIVPKVKSPFSTKCALLFLGEDKCWSTSVSGDVDTKYYAWADIALM